MLHQNKEYDFIVFWNNRNIRRKLTLVMLLWHTKHFVICYQKKKLIKCAFNNAHST